MICYDADKGAKTKGFGTKRHWHSAKKIHFYHGVFLIEAADKTTQASSEVLDADYFTADKLPPLSLGHHLRVPFVLRQLCGAEPIPYFD